MVIQRSAFFRTLTGFHGGLRRGTAAAALGAVLVFVAGTPASNAVVFPSEMQSAETMQPPSTETVASDTEGPRDPKGTPAPPASGGGKRDKPVIEPPTADPTPPREPGPADTGPANIPAAPAASEAAGASGPPAAMSSGLPSALPTAERSFSGSSAYGSVHSNGSTTAQKQPMKQVADVDSYGSSPLLWWGMGLVLLSGIAGMVFLRLRRT